MSVSVLNTDAGLSGKTLLNAESTQTITGAKTFDLDPSAPFVVTSGSAVVANLDADKVDGLEAAAFLLLAGGTMVGDLKFTDATYDIGKSGATRPRDVFLSRTLTVGGTVTVTGGQVAFPATQAASTDANTLDDYEEGSFTPSFGGSGGQSGQVYAIQVGRYVKVGKLVTCWGRIQLSTLGTITTNVQIQGLPFAADATSNYRFSAAIGEWNSFTTSLVYLSADGVASATAMTLAATTAATTGTGNLAQANLSANTALTFTVSYMAAA